MLGKLWSEHPGSRARPTARSDWCLGRDLHAGLFDLLVRGCFEVL